MICNNCVGACIYKQLGKQFSNPFMWSKINEDDFIKLMNNFDSIDFSGIIINVNKEKQVEIKISNDIKIVYQHYIHNSKFEDPTNTTGFDIECLDIVDYAIEKYYSRLKRMVDDPVFILVEDIYESRENPNYYDKLLDFAKDDKYEKILFTNKFVLENDKCINITGDIMNMSSVAIAKSILNNPKLDEKSAELFA